MCTDIIINGSELGAGTRGAGLGPGAMQAVSRTRQDSFFSGRNIHVLAHENFRLDQAPKHHRGRYLEGIVSVHEASAHRVAQVASHGRPFLVLSGDHSCAAATVQGLHQAYPQKRVGVVWIDAHGDLHSPYTTPSGNVHGMPLAALLGVDNKDCTVQVPDDTETANWERFKDLTGRGTSCIRPEDVVLVAVRDTEPPEDSLIEELEIPNHSVEEVRSEGVLAVLDKIRDRLRSCDLLYVSFDVDSMDCDLVSRGTGTPVPNGLTPREAEGFLLGLAADPRTKCMEWVEVNPCLDEKVNMMAETAYDLLVATDRILKEK